MSKYQTGDKLIMTKDFYSLGMVDEYFNVVDAFEGNIYVSSEDEKVWLSIPNNQVEEYFKLYREPSQEKEHNGVKVTQPMIDYIIDNSDFHVETVFGKCTVVSCKLPNGFVIVESSACVDPRNYNEDIGVEICMKKIEDKIWELEGYILQEKFYNDDYDEYVFDDYDEYDCENCSSLNKCLDENNPKHYDDEDDFDSYLDEIDACIDDVVDTLNEYVYRGKMW